MGLKKKIFAGGVMIFGIGFFIVLVILIVLYFYLTSASFIRSYALPAIGDAIGGKVSAQQVSLSLAGSRLKLGRLKIDMAERGHINGEELDCDFQLFPLLNGTYNVDSLDIKGADVLIVTSDQKEDKPEKQTKSKDASPDSGGSSSEAASHFVLKNVHLEGGRFQFKSLDKDGKVKSDYVLNDIAVDCDELSSEKSGKVELSSILAMGIRDQVSIQQSPVKIDADLTLAPGFALQALKLRADIDAKQGKLAGMSLAGNSLRLFADVAQKEAGAWEISQIQIFQNRNGQRRSLVELSGKADFGKPELDMKVKAMPISPEVLNVIGAMTNGVQFGEGSLRYDGICQVNDKGSELRGKLNFENVTFSRLGERALPLPALSVVFNHDLSYHRSNGKTQLREFDFMLTKQNAPMFRVSLPQPTELSIADGKVRILNGKPELRCVIKQLDLKLLNPWLGKALSFGGGEVNANWLLKADVARNVLRFVGVCQIDQLAMATASGDVKNLGLKHELQLSLPLDKAMNGGQGADVILTVNQSRLTLTSGGHVAGSINCAGSARADGKAMNLTVDAQDLNPNTMAIVAGFAKLPVEFRQCDGRLHSQVTLDSGKLVCGGTSELKSLSLAKGSDIYAPLDLTVSWDLAKDQKSLVFKKTDVNAVYAGEKLAHVGLTGNLQSGKIPKFEGAMVSDFLILPVLQKFLDKKTKRTQVAKPTQKKSAPPSAPQKQASVDIPFELHSKLELKQIKTSDNDMASATGMVHLQNSVLSIDDLKVVSGEGSGVFAGKMDFRNGSKFSLKGQGEQLDLRPVFALTDKEGLPPGAGHIQSFNLAFTGKGTTRPEVLKTLTGQAKMKFSNLLLPFDPEGNVYGRIILLPIHALAGVKTLVPVHRLSKSFGKVVDAADDLVNHTKAVDFETGDLVVEAGGGQVRLTEASFIGKKVENLDVRGVINSDESIMFKTKTTILGLTIPIKIKGTLTKPSPDVKGMLKNFLQKTFDTILDPKKVRGIIDSFRGKRNEDQGEQNDQEDQKEPAKEQNATETEKKKKEDPIRKALDRVRGLWD